MRAALFLGSLALSFRPTSAGAQQQTFHLDRLEVPGAPDDGLVLFRPRVRSRAIVYAQLGVGFALNSLRTRDITAEFAALQRSSANVITTQLSTYMSAGFELFDRLTVGGTFPVAWGETGNQPNQGGEFGSTYVHTNFSTNGPAVGDLRLDARYVVLRSDDASRALGLQVGVWLPTGTSTNFGGDGRVEALPMVTGEWTPPHFVTLVANVGVAFRGENSINDPAGQHGPKNGLGIGDELRWALGALIPISGERVRIGATVFGQTGLVDTGTTGPTFLTRQNTPIEWNVEGRVKIGKAGSDHLYLGVGAGSFILQAYGAPDFRGVVLLGAHFPLEGTPAPSPSKAPATPPKDTDGDGIPDDVDACPTVPEDHLEPDPTDGCPASNDRDGDGIPDNVDKCPDKPEDVDGVEDEDGCPELDTDGDGIPDSKDACPKEPGVPDPDPTKNGCPKFIRLEGSTVRVLEQVHFATGSATILEDSFAMLTEIANLLKADRDIHKLRIEGHTDNRGSAEMNLDLSQRRAASVRSWLIGHGISEERLESEGYGLTRPLQKNDTDRGRAANRRVEFHIVEDAEAPPQTDPQQ